MTIVHHGQAEASPVPPGREHGQAADSLDVRAVVALGCTTTSGLMTARPGRGANQQGWG